MIVLVYILDSIAKTTTSCSNYFSYGASLLCMNDFCTYFRKLLHKCSYTHALSVVTSTDRAVFHPKEFTAGFKFVCSIYLKFQW